MYTHSYSFNHDICLHLHSAECTVRLLNQAGRDNYPYNPKFVGNTGNRTRDLLGACAGFLEGVGEENAASKASGKQRATAGSRGAAPGFFC